MKNYRDIIKKKEQDIFRLEEILALLSWDQETGMPEQAIGDRSDQMAWIQQNISDRVRDPEWEPLLAALSDGAESREDKAWHFHLLRRYKTNQCLPPEFMAEFVRITTLSRDAWVQARKADDFSLFQPHLEKVVDMVRQRAALIGFEGEPYNALLDLYEPGMTAETLQSIFVPLQEALLPLIDGIMEKQDPERGDPPSYGLEEQQALHRELLNRMGYDLSRGRMDFSVHPFTTSLGPKDIRITTRLHESDPFDGLYGTMHEAGHGMYEQNLPDQWARTLLGQAVSLGIHESQSRFWENIIGRSRAFCEFFFPRMKEAFPHQMAGKDPSSLFREANRVRRSLIRIQADEYTYNLHVILRFRLERKIINGDAEVADLPELWARESRTLLGVEPANLSEGVLQDIHWSLGDWGYFPSYTLGNLYAAQIWSALKRERPGIEAAVRKGDFPDILGWLTKHIHSSGSILMPQDLITRLSGEPLDARYFIDYLTEKSRELYAD